jgi:hypothetical protein
MRHDAKHSRTPCDAAAIRALPSWMKSSTAPLGAALPLTMSLLPGRFSPQARSRIGLKRAARVLHRRCHGNMHDAMLLLHSGRVEVVRYPGDQHGHALKAAA